MILEQEAASCCSNVLSLDDPIWWERYEKAGVSGKKHHRPYEVTEVELTCQKIICTSKGGKKGFADDWAISS